MCVCICVRVCGCVMYVCGCGCVGVCVWVSGRNGQEGYVFCCGNLYYGLLFYFIKSSLSVSYYQIKCFLHCSDTLFTFFFFFNEPLVVSRIAI